MSPSSLRSDQWFARHDEVYIAISVNVTKDEVSVVQSDHLVPSDGKSTATVIDNKDSERELDAVLHPCTLPLLKKIEVAVVVDVAPGDRTEIQARGKGQRLE